MAQSHWRNPHMTPISVVVLMPVNTFCLSVLWLFFFLNWLFFQNLVTFINWSCCVCCHKAWSWAIFVGFKLHPHTIFRGNNFPFPALCPSTKSFEFFWPAGDTIKNNNKIWAIWPLHGRYFQRKFPNGQIQSIRLINWLVVVIRALALKSGATRLKSSFQLLNYLCLPVLPHSSPPLHSAHTHTHTTQKLKLLQQENFAKSGSAPGLMSLFNSSPPYLIM